MFGVGVVHFLRFSTQSTKPSANQGSFNFFLSNPYVFCFPHYIILARIYILDRSTERGHFFFVFSHMEEALSLSPLHMISVTGFM